MLNAIRDTATPDATLRSGFTLIELLVATAAMGIVVFYTLGTFTLQHQTYVVVDQVSEAQQNSRAIAMLMERDIRNAGYMVAPEAAACGVDNTTSSDILFVSDTDAILPVDQLPTNLAGRELGADVSSAIGSVDPGDTITVGVDDVVIDGTASYDTDGDGNSDSDFQIGAGAILVDVENGSQGVACGFVTSVTPPGSVRVVFQAGLSGVTSVPSDFRLVPAHSYRLVSPGGGAPVELQRDGITLAKDVEDLQLAWFYDDDQDGQVDGGEIRGVSGTAYNTTLVDGNDLRELRLNVVLRTRDDDPRNPTAAGTGQARENRTAASTPGDDGRRRRVHTATVRVRNLTL